ncbi:MAG: hypothetical protein ACFNX0_06980 [Treponema sp.]
MIQWGSTSNGCEQIVYFNSACPFTKFVKVFCQNLCPRAEGSGNFLGSAVQKDYVDSTTLKGFKVVGDQWRAALGFDWFAIGI